MQDEEFELNAIFHALSDSTRREVLDLLREAPNLKVGNIAKVFSMSLNGVSKHIKVLESAGLVKREVEGRDHYLSANLKAIRLAQGWLEKYYSFWSKRLDKMADIIEESKS